MTKPRCECHLCSQSRLSQMERSFIGREAKPNIDWDKVWKQHYRWVDSKDTEYSLTGKILDYMEKNKHLQQLVERALKGKL